MSIDRTIKHGQVNRGSRYARALMALASVVLISACAEQGEKPASTDPARMPIFASPRAAAVNERSATKSDTVKPIPASAATPASWRNDDPSGSRLRPTVTHTALAATIPTALPATSPVATPAR